MNKLTKEENLIEIDKNLNVWLNFDKPVGSILLSRIVKVVEILKKMEISKDHD